MNYYRSREQIGKEHYGTLARLAKDDLMSVADMVSFRHIKDIFIRRRFMDDVSRFADGNLELIEKSVDERTFREAFDNIKEESLSLSEQSTMLSMGTAKIFLTISMEKHKKEVGYLVDGIGVILGGVQIAGGVGLAINAGFTLGKIAGVHITLSGMSAGMQKIAHLLGNNDYVGFMEKSYISTAEFLGFNKKYGSMAYHSLDMTTSMYGIFALRFKPINNGRLFYYIPSDYYRTFSAMSRVSLGFKFIGAGNKLRVVSELNDSDK